jgi:hypothetical protein
MPLIRCTAKLLKELGEKSFEEPDASLSSPTGDWYAHIFFIERRKCIIFLHEPTLFVCLAIDVVKAQYRDITSFFVDLSARTLRREGFVGDMAAILGLRTDLPIGRATNRSTVSSLNNRVTRTKQIIRHHGGIHNCDVAMVTHLLNWMPMAPIGYSNAL